MRFGLWLVLLFVIYTHQTNYIPLVTLDAFQGTAKTLVVTIQSNPVFPISTSNFYSYPTIFGEERDIELIVGGGSVGLLFSAGARRGVFNTGSPNGGTAKVIYQLDGVDGSMNLNPNGLRNFDATVGGNATAFFVVVGVSDIPTPFSILVYGPNNNQIGNYTQIIPNTYSQAVNIVIPYSLFEMSGSGNFSDVGAIEWVITMENDVDLAFHYFGIIGQ